MEKIIKDVNILYGEDLELIKDHFIKIKNGVITEISPQTNLPKDFSASSGKGKYLLPGLIDLHVHLVWDGSLDPVNTLKDESYEQTILKSVFNCKNQIKNGVTTIRDVGSINDVSLHIERGVRNKLIQGPNIIASGKTITMTGGHDPFWACFCDGEQEALKATRKQIFKGAKVIKVSATGGVYGREEGESVNNSELTYEELKTVCETAHNFGLKVASHAIGREGILNSVEAGVDTIEHGQYLDKELIKKMEDKNIAWVPTLYTYKQNAQAQGIPKYAQKKAQEIVELHDKAFANFFRKDILIGCGTDAGSPNVKHPSVIKELLEMKKLYNSNREILKTATSNAGKILDKPIGQIVEGYMADFILTEANPLDDLETLYNIKKVFLRGETIN